MKISATLIGNTGSVVHVQLALHDDSQKLYTSYNRSCNTHHLPFL